MICASTVYSVGPSNAKRTIKAGPLQFVFWERSWSMVGLVVGYTLASILLRNAHLNEDPGVVYVVFVVYAVLGLTIAALIGRTACKNAESPSSSDFASTCKALADRYGLTPRETEILELVAQGRSIPYVQETLNIARGTAVTHMSHIYQKMGIHDRQELIDLVLDQQPAKH